MESFQRALLFLKPGAKAVLKTRALQTLSRPSKTAARREAFGVRAALAPLFRVWNRSDGFKGTKRELPAGRILTPALSALREEGEAAGGSRNFLDRVAMLKYDIPNIRTLFENDLRVLQQF